jgi:hypothetical protein
MSERCQFSNELGSCSTASTFVVLELGGIGSQVWTVRETSLGIWGLLPSGLWPNPWRERLKTHKVCNSLLPTLRGEGWKWSHLKEEKGEQPSSISSRIFRRLRAKIGGVASKLLHSLQPDPKRSSVGTTGCRCCSKVARSKVVGGSASL